MTRELFWLTCTVILTGILWVPYILNRVQVRGLIGSMANPSRNDKPHADWANRLMFAHDNAVENLVIFAPLVLILNALDYSTTWTALAAAVFFWARVAHVIVYTLGIPVFRTAADGDPVAVSIVSAFGRELGLLATNLLKKFDLVGTRPFVVA